MITTFQEKTLVEYALPENIISALRIKNSEIGERLLSSKFLAPVIDAMLVPPLDGKKLSKELSYVVEKILESDLERLRTVSRIVAVFTQNWHFSRSANGKMLRLAVDFSGQPSIINAMRTFDLPIMENIPPIEKLDAENLEMVASYCLGAVICLLPKPLLMRFAFTHPMNGFPQPIELKDRAQDIKLFIAMTGAAFYLLTEDPLWKEGELEQEEEARKEAEAAQKGETGQKEEAPQDEAD